MGVNNRQRRKAKQKSRQERTRVKGRVEESVDDPGTSVEAAVSAAIRAKAHGHEAEVENIFASLSRPHLKAIVDGVLSDWLHDKISDLWQRGWQPADLARAAGRAISPHAQQLLVDMVAAQMRQYARATVDEAWEQQLLDLGAAVWWERDDLYFDAFSASRTLSRPETVGCAIDVVYFVMGLPRLPQLCPPPGEARRGSLGNVRRDADTRTLERVRALLAKAEATPYPEEAETYTAKAQELMTRHSIDYAMLGAPGQQGRAGKHKQQPTARRIAVDNPYEAQKAMLLDVIAGANRCQAIWSRALGFSSIVGFATDVAAAELLFTSLLLQATAALRAAGAQKDGRTTSFRRSFLTAYANRIGQRLKQASQSAMDNASREYGGSLLPVLASRADAVKEAVDQMFPALTYHSAGAPTNQQGWIAGLAAADRAKLDQQLELEFS